MTDMNRIEARMNACSKKQEKAFITYITAGLPDLAATKEIIRAQERGGCDVIELGVPFSDPLADGLIVPDLPFEEQEELMTALDASEDTILIQLVSPVSGARIPKILAGARGFVYCVSSMGVTGQGAEFHKEVRSYLTSVREATDLPVMMGFGIRTAADVLPLADLIDGAIVGSYFIRLLEEQGFAPEAAETYCRTFKKELNA